ncbi:hypothetical protein [Methylobacterium sp. WL119]|uniref:hypothetical protein n=1 Tax=Methylobacterium sp. WL119 TaxID=2603888 RepID=UPI00164F0275|nr:hypothetical protein [Methylobacterium sp. WL119]
MPPPARRSIRTARSRAGALQGDRQGRARLRFSDDAAAARLLLSEFGWTFHRG